MINTSIIKKGFDPTVSITHIKTPQISNFPNVVNKKQLTKVQPKYTDSLQTPYGQKTQVERGECNKGHWPELNQGRYILGHGHQAVPSKYIFVIISKTKVSKAVIAFMNVSVLLPYTKYEHTGHVPTSRFDCRQLTGGFSSHLTPQYRAGIIT